MTSITVEDDRLILTAVMAPGKGCTGHMGPIPGGLAYEDQNGFLWCLACAKHMTSCDFRPDPDGGVCDHPRAVFAKVAAKLSLTDAELDAIGPDCRCHRALNLQRGGWDLLKVHDCPVHFDPRPADAGTVR